jgi:hypothetical protein
MVSPAPVRHFALQILESAIKRGYESKTLKDLILAFITMSLRLNRQRLCLWAFLILSREINTISLYGASPNVTIYTVYLNLDLHNQLAHALTLLFVLSYTTTWHTFFDDCLALSQKFVIGNQTFEPFPTHMVLKILLMIDEEIADLLYAASKKPGDQRINTEIKDRIRVVDVRKVSAFLLEVMKAFQSHPDHVELVRQSLSVIGQWIGTLFSFRFNV